MDQILCEARTRWLRATEVCQILQNYEIFPMSVEAPNKPPSGSLYLYDKTIIRNVRKDGCNWRKKKDGKTVSEAHERLKCSSVEVLHCYYAHGEDNPNFQRRCYWLLDERFMHIVLVHYREVDKNSSRLKVSPGNSNYSTSPMGSTSLTSGQTYGYGDFESAHRNSGSSRTPSPNAFVPISNSYYDMHGNLIANHDDLESVYSNSSSSWTPPNSYNPVSNSSTPYHMHGNPLLSPQDFVSSAGQGNYGVGVMPEQGNFPIDNNNGKKVFVRSLGKKYWEEEDSLRWPMDQNFVADANGIVGRNFPEENLIYQDLQNISQTLGMQYEQHNGYLVQNGFQTQFSNAEVEFLQKSILGNRLTDDLNWNNTPIVEQPLAVESFNTEELLKKVDSFNDWLSKELGEEDSSQNTVDMLLHIRLCNLLSLVSSSDPGLVKTIGDNAEFYQGKLEHGSEESLREQLDTWLLQKVSEDGKGPKVLDKEGQGVIHLASALGYDWAIAPVVDAGVNINFRDVNGWTALHWAAFCGRERTVARLLSMDAAVDAVTDPTPLFPSGLTAFELASPRGHKGISGLLGEALLKNQVGRLSLKDTVDEASQTVPERSFAVSSRSATLFYNTMHLNFRMQSFKRKQVEDYSEKRFGMSNEHALDLVTIKTNRVPGHDEPAHVAATRIQNKNRGFKAGKEYFVSQKQNIKLQAKKKADPKMVWAVKIVEKFVLRWLRKRNGLRGFKLEGPNALSAKPTDKYHGASKNEDEYDFLKEGRKQAEERNQKALDRVNSMVQYPEARDQYCRVLNDIREFQEIKIVDDFLNSSDEVTTEGFDDMSHLETLLYDDTLMSME